MRHLRRQAHRQRLPGRGRWRRSYSYKEETLPINRIVIYTPQSRDAPYEEQDDRFWRLVSLAIVAVVLAGLLFFVLFHL